MKQEQWNRVFTHFWGPAGREHQSCGIPGQPERVPPKKLYETEFWKSNSYLKHAGEVGCFEEKY